MALPVDGFGIYMGFNPTNQLTYRQAEVAAAMGFKVILQYNSMQGSLASFIAYVNYCAALGLKVIVSMANIAIIRNTTWSTQYPERFANFGGLNTDNVGFVVYNVHQLKGLSGIYGWYIADEPLLADVASYATLYTAIKAEDAVHPVFSVANELGNPANYDVIHGVALPTVHTYADIVAGDHYSLATSWPFTLASDAAAIQAYATAKGKQSGIVVDCMGVELGWDSTPLYFVYETLANMMTYYADVLANMTPQLVMWYSYFSALSPYQSNLFQDIETTIRQKWSTNTRQRIII